MEHSFNRRTILTGTALLASAGLFARTASADVVPGEDGFGYEITRSDQEWRTLLSEAEYEILRKGGTETPKSSPLWDETREGQYTCKGCDLPVYASEHKIVLDKGWLFYRVSVPNALLMSIDGPPEAMSDMLLSRFLSIEVHCRRCGSHMGHVLPVEGQVLHCINGSSLNFTPA